MKAVQTKEHRTLALNAAADSVILLKNESSLLPFCVKTEPEGTGSALSIVVMGPNAHPTPTGGGGSSYVDIEDPVSIFEGLQKTLKGKYRIKLMQYTGAEITENDRFALQGAEYVVVCAGYNNIIESECFDRSWTLPDNQADLIRTAAGINKNTIVIVNAGAAFETESWLSEVPVLIHALYLGAESGNAIANVLTGAICPGGKLPFSIAKNLEDYSSTANYPKNPDVATWERYKGPDVREEGLTWSSEKLLSYEEQEQWDIEYSEGIFVGYRHFDTRNVATSFPFGFGLSYSTFALTDLKLSASYIKQGDSLEIALLIENTGDVTGSEVIQIYVQDEECSVPRPVKELKGFEKVKLLPSEKKRISVILEPDAFMFYDVENKTWTAEPGRFEILIGFNSQDIVSVGMVELC